MSNENLKNIIKAAHLNDGIKVKSSIFSSLTSRVKHFLDAKKIEVAKKLFK